ncbi:hypothetical protein ACJJTC_005692 [Scirpophaga incertulas]
MIIGRVDVTVSKKNLINQERKLKQQYRSVSPAIASTSSVNLDISTSSLSSETDEPLKNDACAEKIESVFPLKKKKKVSSIDLPTVSKTCDRYGVSDRAAAVIVSSVLHDIGSEVEVIDRSKLRRERNKTRQELQKQVNLKDISALYFDGRKDKTLKIIKKGNRNYRKVMIEEHTALVQEPGSTYLGYVVPHIGSAKGIAFSITNFLKQLNISHDGLMAIGCDGTNVNTGKYGGIIRLLEKQLNKPLQWIICLLHMNELPLRHLFFHLDGSTSGPKSYNGPLGKALENCEELPVIKYKIIEGDMLPEMPNDLSTDQKYLHRIVSAIITGTFPDDLGHKSPGKLSHARWLTRANRLLRLYVATENPTSALVTLTTFIVKVYAPSWFAIKSKPSCKDGSRHLFNIIYSSRYLPDDLKGIVDTVIQRNAYFAHAENVLLAMITDERKHIRELAARRILKARSSAAVERAVKITTEAATSMSQCTKKSRLGAIKAKLQSRAQMPKFDTKCHFKPN